MTSATEPEQPITPAESDWRSAFAAVPRSAFLPDLMWPHDMATGQSVVVDRAQDPDAWQRYADANVPIVTQWDDGVHEGTEPGRVFTSSSSMPSVVRSMLTDLEVTAGQRALEIGTGTGWNAALLAHRLGPSSVVSVEIDGAVASAARGALERFGSPVKVVHGDGFAGHPEGAPFDRVIATCGFREIPHAWVEQTAPGGVILVPWGTYYGFTEATARLVVAEDGRSASGNFTRPVTFMRMRSQRRGWPRHSDYVPAKGTGGADKSSTKVPEAEFLTGSLGIVGFAVGLRVPDCTHAADRKENGKRPVWFYGLSDRSWAVVIFRDGPAESTVYQSGPRRLWDEAESAWHWWNAQSRPGFSRFGLTVTPDGQTTWLDEPANVLAP